MKSVGEAMTLGRTFKESLQKCLRSLEIVRWFLVQIKEIVDFEEALMGAKN